MQPTLAIRELPPAADHELMAQVANEQPGCVVRELLTLRRGPARG